MVRTACMKTRHIIIGPNRPLLIREYPRRNKKPESTEEESGGNESCTIVTGCREIYLHTWSRPKALVVDVCTWKIGVLDRVKKEKNLQSIKKRITCVC